MRKQRSVGLVLGLAVVSALGVAVPAGATSDKKNYPGTTCQPGGVGATDLSYNYDDGYVANVTGGTRHAVCPVVADCGGMYSTGHWVYVYQTTANAIGCRMCRYDRSTGSGGCGSRYSTATTYSYARIDVTNAYTSSMTYGYSYFDCEMSGSGTTRISAYGVDENC